MRKNIEIDQHKELQSEIKRFVCFRPNKVDLPLSLYHEFIIDIGDKVGLPCRSKNIVCIQIQANGFTLIILSGKNATIKVDRSITYQEIVGFGGALTGSASWNLDQLTPALQNHVYRYKLSF